jgi:hypothetical protein
MANDVTLPGNGAVVATEDVGGGREVQIVKLWSSTPGTQQFTKPTNSALASSDDGILLVGVRRDQPTASATLDGNYAYPTFDSLGRLRVVTTTDSAESPAQIYLRQIQEMLLLELQSQGDDIEAESAVIQKLQIDNAGGLKAQPYSTATAITAVASGTSNQVLLEPNAFRKGGTVVNDSTSTLYLKCGSIATSTSYTVKMTAGSYYEIPFGYTGEVDGIWVSANGNAVVTEFT